MENVLYGWIRVRACLWDFDRIMEMTDEWSRQHSCGVFAYGPLFYSSNLDFINEYYCIWEEKKTTIFGELKACLSSFSKSAEYDGLLHSLVLDNERWGQEHDGKESLDNLIEWFATREYWMDEAIQKEIAPKTSTSIEVKKADSNNADDYYDLNGRKSNRLSKGFLIKNGHKYINRRAL